MNEQANLATVHALFSAFGSGDLPTILDLLSDDIAWTVVGDPQDAPFFGRREGKIAVTGFFAALAERITGLDCTPQTYQATGDMVIVTGHDKATVRATGQRYATDWVHLFTLRDGKVVAFREFYDTATIARAFQPGAGQ